MANDPKPIQYIVQQLLQGSLREGGLTELEKLVIVSIVQNITYGRASTEYTYTESSFQNAASKLFRDLSQAVGITISRRNFLDVMAKELQVNGTNGEIEFSDVDQIVFDRLQASFWVKANRATLVSVEYQAQQDLEMTGYLIRHSPQFAATFCLDVGEPVAVIETLVSLCGMLQVNLPSSARRNVQMLLKGVGAALRARSTLLVMRFDRLRQPMDRSLRDEYVDAVLALATMDRSGCLMLVDKAAMGLEAMLNKSLVGEINGRIDVLSKNRVLPGGDWRLMTIKDDRSVICDLLQTYLR
jgi:hypothetical protein